MFNDREEYENNEGSQLGGLIALKAVGTILGIVFLPSILLAYLIYAILFKIKRLKPHISAILLSLMFVILYFIMSRLNAFAGVGKLLEFSAISNNVGQIIASYIALCILLSLVVATAIIFVRSWQLHKDPEMKYIKGWAYKFEYAATPFDLFRRKRIQMRLVNGEEYDYEKAPIGILEENVRNRELEDCDKLNTSSEIIYRYYSEANKHSIITGATGSGKALHKDTAIPTPTGMRTVGDIRVGDILWDESGSKTKVLGVYQPKTPDHYEVIFDNGETVKACGDHLWDVVDVGNTVSTRELQGLAPIQLPGVRINGSAYEATVIDVITIDDNADDYYCFTVDSPSSLFLITDSYIPTHNTVTMLSLIYNDVLSSNPVCVIDFKKSPDLIYFLSKWAKENNREFYHFTSGRVGTYRNPFAKEQATYDPLSTGSATSKADMILNLRAWDSSSEVFKKRTQDILQSIFYLLERTPHERVPGIEWDKGGLAQFVSALNLSNLKQMIEIMNEDAEDNLLSEGDQRRLTSLVNLYNELGGKGSSGLKDQVNELVSICRTLIVSSYGDWIAKGSSSSHINLMEIALNEKGPIVLFSFNPQEEADFARYMGSIVLSDLNRVSALKNAKGDLNDFMVYIDEFQTLSPESVTDLLEKARSARISITLSLQSLEQIVKSASKDGESSIKAIMDTCSNFIFHDGASYDSAERMSKIIGKAKKYVYRTSSKMSSSAFSLNIFSRKRALVSKDIEEDWLVPPSEFQSLESPGKANKYKSTAYVINKSISDPRFANDGGALARKVHVVVNSEISQGIPDDFREQIYIPSIEEEHELAKERETDLKAIDEEIDGGWAIEEINDDLNNFEDIEVFSNDDEITFETKPSLPKAKSQPKNHQTSFDLIKNKPKQREVQVEESFLPELD